MNVQLQALKSETVQESLLKYVHKFPVSDVHPRSLGDLSLLCGDLCVRCLKIWWGLMHVQVRSILPPTAAPLTELLLSLATSCRRCRLETSSSVGYVLYVLYCTVHTYILYCMYIHTVLRTP